VNRRLRAQRAVRRGALRWWLVYGPVRSGTTLMANLIAPSARWLVSDWGLHAALAGPFAATGPFDRRRVQRALMAEVLAAVDSGHGGPVDLVYKQANLRRAEYDDLVGLFGPPQRRIFCLRDPAGFMSSAVRKFPDVDLDNLQEINYVGTSVEHDLIGGEVFHYHPAVTGEDYASFLAPLVIPAELRATVRYTGSAAPELATEQMWAEYHRLLEKAVNRPAGG